MAVSGSYTDFTPDAIDLIERSYARCGRDLTGLSAEDAINAKSELNVLLKELAADGINLWCVEDFTLPLYPYQRRALAPTGTRNFIEPINYRTVSNVTASQCASSAGGTVAYAFDEDVDTRLIQTSADGNVRAVYSGVTPVTVLGILPGTTAEWNLVAEVSDDGVTWRTVLSLGAIDFVDRVWRWFDINDAVAALYFRIRETGGGTLNVRELVFGSFPQELPVGRINWNDYEGLPNKYQTGNIPIEFAFDRQRDSAYVYVWPTITNIYMHLCGRRIREMYDVATFTETIDIPRPWYAALIDLLALRLGKADPKRTQALWQELKEQAQKSWNFIDEDEIDQSPISISYGIGGYTR